MHKHVHARILHASIPARVTQSMIKACTVGVGVGGLVGSFWNAVPFCFVFALARSFWNAVPFCLVFVLARSFLERLEYIYYVFLDKTHRVNMLCVLYI